MNPIVANRTSNVRFCPVTFGCCTQLAIGFIVISYQFLVIRGIVISHQFSVISKETISDQRSAGRMEIFARLFEESGIGISSYLTADG